jgi:hypothetical protein
MFSLQNGSGLDASGTWGQASSPGNGSPMEVLTPVTNVPRRFYRVRQP